MCPRLRPTGRSRVARVVPEAPLPEADSLHKSLAARLEELRGPFLARTEAPGTMLYLLWGEVCETERPFPRLVRPKPGETVIFAWIVYKSRADRNRVLAKVMKDPRFAAMDPNAM